MKITMFWKTWDYEPNQIVSEFISGNADLFGDKYIEEKNISDNWQDLTEEAIEYYNEEEQKKIVMEDMQEMYYYRLCENR